MLLRAHQPQAPLAAHVDYLWQLHDMPGHAAERVLPSGTVELVINLAQDAFNVQTSAGTHHLSGTIVSGAYQSYFVIDTRDHADVVGVHFRPGSAWPVLGVPPGLLADRHSDLANLWGDADVRRLRERLYATPSDLRLQILEAFLSARSEHDWQLHPACHEALDALARGARVADVAAVVGLSPRRLQSLFQEHVGTTPKLFARLCRFQRAVARLATDASDHAELAVTAGYCDQSHMIREFHAIAGCPPTEMARARRVEVKQHHLAERGSSDLSKT